MRDSKLYIDDIIEAIDKIFKYISGMDLSAFENDSKTFDSVLHNFLVIGEAAARLPDELIENYPNTNWRE